MPYLFQSPARPGWHCMLLVWLGCVALLLSGCGGGGSPERVYRVGILSGLNFFADAVDSFKMRMTELGYIEGQNISYDIQQTDIDLDTYQRILDQFVVDEVDLIFVFPTEAALVARAATQGTDIPVVFFAFTEGVDLIQSVDEPGGNITGVRFPGADIALKRFEILRELVPRTRRIWIPYQRNYPTVARQLTALYPVAADVDITLIELPAANATELAVVCQDHAARIDPEGDAIMFLAEPLAVTPDAFTVIAGFAAEHQIPLGGALMAMNNYKTVFGVDANSVVGGRQAASLADKIFQGTPAGSIPLVAAEMILQIDYAAAQQLGIPVSEGLLHQADQVIR